MQIWRGMRSAGVIALTSLLVAANLPSAPASAQDSNWWEGINGFGPQSFSNKGRASERTPPKPDAVNDLRPNDVPWRSDEMRDAMQAAIDRYEQIVNRGGWPIIPGNHMMRAGDEHDRVPLLRRRLRATGELTGGTSYDDYGFDSTLEAAVIRFQERNGLRASGRVDQPTLAALNVTAEERLAQ